jgi:hypothetical protein
MTAAMPDTLYRPLLALMLSTLAANIILGAGFMLLRLPPVGPGVPVNEMVLVTGLGLLLLGGRGMAGLAAAPAFAPLYALWLLCGAHLVMDVPAHGIWAIRDAANMLESGFFVIGFCLAADPRFRAPLLAWLPRVFLFAAVYSLLYPFQPWLVAISPTVSGMSGYKAPLLFNFVNTSSVALTAVAYVLLRRDWPLLARAGLAGIVVMSLIVFVQARITYLQLAFLVGLFALFARRELGQMAVMGLLALLFMTLFLASGITLPGRLGQTFSFAFLASHVQAIWGGGGDATRDAAQGVDLRMAWWMGIHAALAEGPRTWFLGLGYGLPLTPFRGLSDDVVREPHNSYVSIYGRLGVLGIGLFLTFLATIAAAVTRLIRHARRAGDRDLYVAAMTIACFLGVHLIYSAGEGGMEVSFIAVPFYFLAGAVAAMSARTNETGALAPVRSVS